MDRKGIHGVAHVLRQLFRRAQSSRILLCRDDHFRPFHRLKDRIDMFLVLATEMVVVGIGQLRDLRLIALQVDNQLVGGGYAGEQQDVSVLNRVEGQGGFVVPVDRNQVVVVDCLDVKRLVRV